MSKRLTSGSVVNPKRLNKLYAKEGTVTVTCVRGDGLKDVQMIGKQDPYVVCTLLQPPWPEQQRRTRPHNDGGRSPRWAEKFKKKREHFELR